MRKFVAKPEQLADELLEATYLAYPDQLTFVNDDPEAATASLIMQGLNVSVAAHG